MKKEYMAPEFEDLELFGPAIMDIEGQTKAGDIWQDGSNPTVEEEDPFA